MIVKAASMLLFVSLSTVTVSVDSNTTLFPPMNSSDDPCGIGAFFNKLTSSLVSDVLETATPTFTPDPDVLETTDTLTVDSDTNNSVDAALTIMEIT